MDDDTDRVIPIRFVLAVVAVLLVSGVLVIIFSVLDQHATDKDWIGVWRGLSVLFGVFVGSATAVLFIEFFAISHLANPLRKKMEEVSKGQAALAEETHEAAAALAKQTRETSTAVTNEIRAELQQSRDQAEQLANQIHSLLAFVKGERESGKRAHYVSREQAVGAIYKAITEGRVTRQAYFLGICNGIFEELDQKQALGFRSALLQAMRHGCEVHFLYLSRDEWQLYLSRHQAETRNKLSSVADFEDNCGLIKDTRRSLNRHTLRLYIEAVEKHLEDRITISEYHIMPSVSIIILDDRMFVTPYIAEQCKHVPAAEYTLEFMNAEGERFPDSQHYQETYEAYQRDATAISPRSLARSQRSELLQKAKRQWLKLTPGNRHGPDVRGRSRSCSPKSGPEQVKATYRVQHQQVRESQFLPRTACRWSNIGRGRCQLSLRASSQPLAPSPPPTAPPSSISSPNRNLSPLAPAADPMEGS